MDCLHDGKRALTDLAQVESIYILLALYINFLYGHNPPRLAGHVEEVLVQLNVHYLLLLKVDIVDMDNIFPMFAIPDLDE